VNERKKKKRKVGKECNLIDIFVCLFVVVVVDKFLFLFFIIATNILIEFRDDPINLNEGSSSSRTLSNLFFNSEFE